MRRTAGFTLIELLVVVMIMGIVIASVSLTLFDTAGEKLEQESYRLRAAIEYAQDKAALENRQFALGFALDGYAFYELGEERQWQQLESDRLLRTHAIPEPLEVELYLEGIKAVLDSKLPERPQLFFLSSGEAQPFELLLHSEEQRVTLTGDALGRLELEFADGH